MNELIVEPMEWKDATYLQIPETVVKRYSCVEEMCYYENNLNAPLPTLPVNLGRQLGKRAYKSERQKAKARVGMLKPWVESPLDTTRQRNSGRNSEG